MARRAVLSSPEASDNEQDVRSNGPATRRRNARVANPASLSPSPTASFSSDKENRATTQTSRGNNGKTTAMAPPSNLPAANSTEPGSDRASKRRRLSERDAPDAPDSSFAAGADDPGNTPLYDPDQNIDERRAIRKDYRDLSKELTGTISALDRRSKR